MHDTAFALGGRFLDLYAPPGDFLIAEVGAQNVNGSLRSAAPSRATYIGIDIEAGRGVDLVATGAALPLPTATADLVIASSVFEHDPAFWQTFCELSRITKPGGYIYISAPSNGVVHRFPQDCWRFYPDAGEALANWARRNDFPVTLVESFTADQGRDLWNDYVAVFIRGVAATRPGAFAHTGFSARNVRRLGSDELLSPRVLVEDQDLIAAAARAFSSLEQRVASIVSGSGAVVAAASSEHGELLRIMARNTDPANYGDCDFSGERPDNPFAQSQAIIENTLAVLAAELADLRVAVRERPRTLLDRLLSRTVRSMPWLIHLPGYGVVRRASHRLRDIFR